MSKIQFVKPFHLDAPDIVNKYEINFTISANKQTIGVSFYIRSPDIAVNFVNYFNEKKASLSLCELVSSYIGDLPERQTLLREFGSIEVDLFTDHDAFNTATITDARIVKYYDGYGRELKVIIDKQIDFAERFVFYKNVPNGDENCGNDVCTVYANYLASSIQLVVREDEAYAYCVIDFKALLHSGWIDDMDLPEDIEEEIEVRVHRHTTVVECLKYPQLFKQVKARNQ